MRLLAWLEPRLARLWWRKRPSLWLLCLSWPFSLVYRWLWALRERRTAEPLPVPVIVVGNFVVGGAGKTPTVIALVQALQAAGRRPGVISRGHGRRSAGAQAVGLNSAVQEVGDEPLLIHRRTGVPVWVGRARREAAQALLQAHPGLDVIVSDDGLQHRGLPRQVEVVVFDERGAGNGLLLPAGPMREPLPSTPTARQRVLYTAGIQSTPMPGLLAERRLRDAWPLSAWHEGDASRAVPLSSLQGRQLIAAAGLAAPEKFFAMLRLAGLTFTPLPLPDHDPYHQLPWPADATDVLLTEKDAVKLSPARVGRTRVWVVPLDLAIPAGLVEDLLNLLPPRPPQATP